MTNTGPCSLRHHGTGFVSVPQKQGFVLDLLYNATVPDVSLFLRNRAMCRNASVTLHIIRPFNRLTGYTIRGNAPVTGSSQE